MGMMIQWKSPAHRYVCMCVCVPDTSIEKEWKGWCVCVVERCCEMTAVAIPRICLYIHIQALIVVTQLKCISAHCSFACMLVFDASQREKECIDLIASLPTTLPYFDSLCTSWAYKIHVLRDSYYFDRRRWTLFWLLGHKVCMCVCIFFVSSCALWHRMQIVAVFIMKIALFYPLGPLMQATRCSGTTSMIAGFRIQTDKGVEWYKEKEELKCGVCNKGIQ